MRLVWVPQWTVLPVIVEDRAMSEEGTEHARTHPILPLEDVASASKVGGQDDGSSSTSRKPSYLNSTRMKVFWLKAD